MGIFNFKSKSGSGKPNTKRENTQDNPVKIYFGKFKDCDYVVAFCEKETDQKNHEKIMGGKLVMNENEADISVRFEVVNPSKADILIVEKNFPTY